MVYEIRVPYVLFNSVFFFCLVLENEDNLPDLREDDFGATKDALAVFIKELDTVKLIAKLNSLEHTKLAYKNPITPVK